MVGRIHIILFFFIGIIYFKRLIRQIESFFIFLAIILTISMISVGNYDFLNYYIPIVPLFALPYATVCYFFIKKLSVNPKLIICLLFLLLGSGCIILKDKYNGSDSTENLIAFIKENSEESDKITALGFACWIYIQSDRESVSKYFYQSPPSIAKQYGAMFAESYLNDVKKGKPRIIITNKSYSKDWDIYLSGLKDILNSQYEKAPFVDKNFDCWIRVQGK
jgi:hypothetical protein